MTSPDGFPAAPISVPDLARLLGVSPRTGWRLVRDGTIPVIRIGRSVRVPPAVVRALLTPSTPR